MYIQIRDFETAKRLAEWGTFEGEDPKQPLRWVKLIDCDTNHLQKILTQPGGRGDYALIINSILEDRKKEIKQKAEEKVLKDYRRAGVSLFELGGKAKEKDGPRVLTVGYKDFWNGVLGFRETGEATFPFEMFEPVPSYKRGDKVINITEYSTRATITVWDFDPENQLIYFSSYISAPAKNYKKVD